jgi:hypothetical protein
MKHTINISKMCYTELLLLRQKAETHSTGFNKKINREAE